MKITLLSYTKDPELAIAAAAKLCYSDKSIQDIADHFRDPAKMVDKLKSMGHMSPFEHASFTFGIEGVSRAMLAQITRHRIASFSVQSQRYVRMKGFEYITPDTISENPDAEAVFKTAMETAQRAYDALIDMGIPKEDARFVLPNAASTRMLVTMNARELMHFFELRCCGRAQWEIRAVAWQMLKCVMKAAPNVFKGCGPNCLRSGCTEGGMSCGQMQLMEDCYNEITKDVMENSDASET